MTTSEAAVMVASSAVGEAVGARMKGRLAQKMTRPAVNDIFRY